MLGRYGGVEFWPLPLKWLVTLTTVLRYRAACDLVILHTICNSWAVSRPVDLKVTALEAAMEMDAASIQAFVFTTELD